MEEYGNQQDDQKRGEGSAQGTADGSSQLAKLIADEDADIDGKHTRTTLRNGNQVDELLFRDPVALIHHFGLDEGYHGISTPQGE